MSTLVVELPRRTTTRQHVNLNTAVPLTDNTSCVFENVIPGTVCQITEVDVDSLGVVGTPVDFGHRVAYGEQQAWDIISGYNLIAWSDEGSTLIATVLGA